MDKFKMLSGEELVTQGAKKVNSTLPELGLKDIVPNGSWLEQRQIQSSLEARRHIVEVERIEKCGSLSQADWNEELQLAEVSKNAGSHWQYIGHNIGRQLYLYPEEALYLMEVSCLQLKYNDVTVSIQQAYSLLLKDNASLNQYKVYASLSRLGYKVLRHTYVKPTTKNTSTDTENDEFEVKLENPSSSYQICEVTDTSGQPLDNKDINKKSEEDGAKETIEMRDCAMTNISNVQGNEGQSASDETYMETDVTVEHKENIDKKQEHSLKESNDIAEYQINDTSNEVKINNNVNAAKTTDQLSSGDHACVATGISNKQTNDNKISKETETQCVKVIGENSDCQNDISENVEKGIELINSECTGELPYITNQQMKEKGGKQSDDIAENSNTIHDVSDVDHIENETTEHKTEKFHVSSKDIVQNTENRDAHSLLVDIKENCKLDDCEVICMETDYTDGTKVSSSVDLCDDDSKESTEKILNISGEIANSSSTGIIQNKIDILSCRALKPSNSDMVHHCITENLPDFYQKQIVTVKAPDEQLIPRNVFLNNTAYVLNLENLKLKSVTPAPSSSQYSVSDEANEQHVRRIRSANPNQATQIPFNSQFFPNLRFPQQPQYRPFNYWSQYTWNYQRPFFAGMPFRFQFFPRFQPIFRCITPRSMIPNIENTNPRRGTKRKRDNPKVYHLESIKKLAFKLKCLVASGNRQEENIQALQRLINTYNIRYKSRIELTPQLDIVENEIILETIDLEDDDQSTVKKKKNEEVVSYDENFNAVKRFSIKIKELDAKKLLTTRHKRAFSNVIRTFNKSYNADIYVDSNYEVIDRRRIVIASSSDSDCAVDESQITTELEDTSKPRRSRKLRNPFYILKQLSEKQSPAKTSQDSESSQVTYKKKFQYSDHLKKMFSKYWLPSEDDFGRAEVPVRTQIRYEMNQSEEFLYQFMRTQPVFKNWLDAKIAYWQSCKEAALKYEAHSQNETVKLDSIIKPEDCTDLRNVLKKLSIIRTTQDIHEECSLAINFDVYQRDVQNFKKTKKPMPHFRVTCISESSSIPTGADFATLHSKYDDDVVILFAIVGQSSISYLQMNPVDLPLYLPSNNLP